jgi:flagellar biosynthesis GTPase FlhF
MSSGTAWSQVRISVGSVTKYTGGPVKLEELKQDELYLSTLESQTASALINSKSLDYLDRTSVEQIFQELNLTSDVAFNSSSGALRGLLGRLDFLIVIDGSSPALARMRGIDLESGAVRATATCKRSPSLFGGPEDGNESCVHQLVNEMQAAMADAAGRKERRIQQQAAEHEAVKAAEQKAAELEAKKRDDAAREQKKEAAAARAQAAEEERQAKEEEAKQEHLNEKLDAQLTGIRPDLEDAQARLTSANAFWSGIQREMAGRGQSLRPEIQTRLRAANANRARCQTFLESRQPDNLASCIHELNKRLDELEDYK